MDPAKLGSLHAPPPGTNQTVSAEQQAALAQATAPLKGFVIWSSNRHGNHDLLMLKLPGHEVSRLTDHPHGVFQIR